MSKQPLTRTQIREELSREYCTALSAQRGILIGCGVALLSMLAITMLIVVSTTEGMLPTVITLLIFALPLALMAYSYLSLFRLLRQIERDAFRVVTDEVTDKEIYYSRHHRSGIPVLFFLESHRQAVGRTLYELSDRGDRYYLVFVGKRSRTAVKLYREEAFVWVEEECGS